MAQTKGPKILEVVFINKTTHSLKIEVKYNGIMKESYHPTQNLSGA